MMLSQLSATAPGAVFLLAYSAPVVFGFFAAYWAQQTRRNAWLWFVFGALLTPIAGVVLLMLNRDSERPAPVGEDLSRHLSIRNDVP